MQQESDESSLSSTLLLLAIASAVIAVLLVFHRQVSDVILSMAGLILTIVWAFGFQGLLDPDGLGAIGAPQRAGDDDRATPQQAESRQVCNP